MAERVWGEEYRTTRICIDAFEKGIPQGRFYNPYMEAEQPFESLMQLLQGMEGNLERMAFPKAYQVTRTFAPLPRACTSPVGEAPLQGKIATFAVRILFRQNASWQGNITWLEGKKEQSFRSVLELILLMNTALQSPMESQEYKEKKIV